TCLACRSDGREVDKGADTAPRQAGEDLDLLLVVVDAVFSGRLRGVEAGQQERRREPGDGLGGSRCHGCGPSAGTRGYSLLHSHFHMVRLIDLSMVKNGKARYFSRTIRLRYLIAIWDKSTKSSSY